MSEKPPEYVFGPDVRNESVLVAAAIVDPAVRRALTTRLAPDVFLVPEHRAVWEVLSEMARRGIDYDHAAAARLSNGGVKIDYLVSLVADRPDAPDDRTVDYHVETLLWDKAKHTALTGPVAMLLESLRDPRVPVEKSQALGEQVAAALRGYKDRRFLHDSDHLVRQTMAGIRKKIDGQARYPYGVPGLDFYDPETQQNPRMTPGAAPGEVTILTAVSGAGKSTFAAHLALGLGRQRRKVMIGAWEMSAQMTLEILSVLALGWSRTEILAPKSRMGATGLREGVFLTPERLDQLERTMRKISRYVKFMDPPGVRDRGSRRRRTNDEVIDTLTGYIADVAPDVVIFDLWKKALPQRDPSDEEDAFDRLQELAREFQFHAVVCHQQRLKDVETREDPRPTREGLKGSAAYVENADTILALSRPSIFKAVEDDTLEVYVLKQRFGKWPLQVNFDWVADTGQISGGEPVDYDSPRKRAQINATSGMGAFYGKKTLDAVDGGRKKKDRDE